jgi:phosphomannomutase
MPLVESFSGIRGIYDDGLDEKVAARYAYSYFSLLKNKYKNKNLKIVIGTDTRQSRDILKNIVTEVLNCDIIDIGIASTPMTEFAVRHFNAHGGIIITASHNEPYWNGFKFLDYDGAVLRPKDMETVIKKYRNIKKINIKKISKKRIIKKYNEINNAYISYILNFLDKEDKDKIKNSKLKVIIDPNGGTGIIAKQILEKLNIKVHGINMEHGIFNRTIEPDEESLIYLANEVRDKNYDFAAGFDCDADRVEVMTSKGLVSGNQLLALIADEILKSAKNKVIVVNDATSGIVKDIAKKHNAEYIETQVGEINVVDNMYKSKALIGGEGSSSGIIIPNSRCRDGILTLIYLLKIMANKEKNLNQLIKTLPEYCYIKRKINIDSKKYSKIKGKLIDFYRKKYKVKDSKEGSLKVTLKENSFVWFRVSKTESNILRIIADSPKKSRSESIINEAVNLIKNKA